MNIFLLLCISLSCFILPGNAQVFNVKAFGAKGDGIADDRQPILLAIEAARSWSKAHPGKSTTIYFPAAKRCYLVNSITMVYPLKPGVAPENRTRNFVFPLHSNLQFKGESRKQSIIKIADHLFDSTAGGSIDAGTGEYRNANLFYASMGDSVHHLVFSNFTIDFNGQMNLLPPGQNSVENNVTGKMKSIYGILLDGGGHHVSITQVNFINNPGRNDIVANAPGHHLYIRDCLFLNGGMNVGSLTVPNLQANDFSAIYSEWSYSTFTHNTILQEYPEWSLQAKSFAAAIEIHGSNSLMEKNNITGCKPAVYVASNNVLSKDFSKDNQPLTGITISGNRMYDCHNGIVFWIKNPLINVVIDNNTINMLHFKYNPFCRAVPDGNKLLAGIMSLGGNLPCARQYVYGNCNGCANYNLNPISRLSITNNKISTEVGSSFDSAISATGILLHSIHDANVCANQISRMNWSGIVLQGSRWGSRNVEFSKNTIQLMQYNLNPKMVVSYMAVLDWYLPASDCSTKKDTTFRNVMVIANKFIPNQVTNQQSVCTSNRYACFRALYFDIPQWYGYRKGSEEIAGLQRINKAVFQVQFASNPKSFLFKQSSNELHVATAGCSALYCQ